MKQAIVAGTAALAMAAVIAACAPDQQMTTARSDYMNLCAGCHGTTGKGNGPAAAGQNPRPADITTIAARHDGEFPRLQVMSHIYGYTMGRSESPMPQFGDLLEGRTVMYDAGDGRETPTPQRLVALMEYVERMQE
ncbi:MAG: cytochrome C [Paracoccus sp. (in: a-proteobacteria)]|uniref:c-type cytochrome n=1 Tax=Paracoccus sp. TaxID=267 RepID=UPI0026DFC5E6|nr:c-type cytochrome [Paracoccus sp. (in: a-proteobacteria)]MDO5630964.1 cytochrome C [Paracoccus sp. (in: a-proteobacteria)]